MLPFINNTKHEDRARRRVKTSLDGTTRNHLKERLKNQK
jgi:hypothetical protein